ncbi:MAG: hypothetical protein LBE02_04225 [Spirochaetaceae bacterium]|nr:hypothetical protein [Spirochaetaceae bacterium]
MMGIEMVSANWGGLLNALIQPSIGCINRYMGAPWGSRGALVFSFALGLILLLIRRKRR